MLCPDKFADFLPHHLTCHCDVSLGVIETGDLMKHTITSVKLLISLGRKIVGNVWNNVGTQPKKIYY